jgi:hypothetical protein
MVALSAVLAAVFVLATVTSTPASARALWSGDYARAGLAYEGHYPASTPCNHHFYVVRTKTFNWYGRHGTLRMYYHPSCGAFVRVDNIETYCYTAAYRIEPGETGQLVGHVTETSDGLHYAYTQMANNLHGRLARGEAICSGTVVADTGWY